MTPEHPLKADLVLLLTTLLAAAGWLFSKEAIAGLPPLYFVALRFLIAGGVLGLVGRAELRTLDGSALRGAFLIGVLFAAAMALWISGLAHSRHLGEGAFISSLGVVLIPVIARLFFGERPPRATWTALPVALAGFACLSLAHGFRVEPGQWLFLAAAVTFAVLFNVNSHFVRNVPVVALGTLQMGVVGVLVLPAALMLEDWPRTVSAGVLGWLAASALLATALRFMLQLHGQRLTTPSHAAVIMMLEPVFTALLAAWWFGERMSMLQLSGCGLIFIALVLSRWRWIAALLRTVWPRSD